MSVLATKDTKVITQGFTGAQKTFQSGQAIAYGTGGDGGATLGGEIDDAAQKIVAAIRG